MEQQLRYGTASTDEEGIARFDNVERGEHTLAINYSGFSGEGKVVVDGEQEKIVVNVEIQVVKAGFGSPIVQAVIAALCLVIVLLSFFLLRLHVKFRKSINNQ